MTPSRVVSKREQSVSTWNDILCQQVRVARQHCPYYEILQNFENS